MADLRGRALVVIGSPRSGTSSVTNALHRMGFFFGDESKFFAADENNLAGYFELKELIALNKRCMDALYLAHDRPFVPFDLLSHPAAPRLVADIRRVLSREFAGKDVWGWKEPTTTLLLPLFKEALDSESVEPHFILCVRHPAEVTASQDRFLKVSPEYIAAPLGLRGYGTWLAFTLAALNETRGRKRTLVQYDQFLREPKPVLQRIASVTPSPATGPESLEAAIEAVEPAMRRWDLSGASVAELPGIVSELWALCGEMSGKPEEFQEGGYDSRIEEISREIDSLRRVFSEPDPPQGVVKLTDPSGRAAAMHPYLPEPAWQRLELQVDAEPGTLLSGALYQLPGHFYVRNAKWLVDGAEQEARLSPSGGAVQAHEGQCLRFGLGFGQNQFALRTPALSGPYRLHLEIFAVVNVYAVLERLAKVEGTAQALEHQLAALTTHAANLEEEVLKLRKGRP